MFWQEAPGLGDWRELHFAQLASKTHFNAVRVLSERNLDPTWPFKLASQRNLDSTWPVKLASKRNLDSTWPFKLISK